MSREDPSLDDAALDHILKTMGHNPGIKPPPPDLPTPEEPEDLTPEQQQILDDLPDEKGFYWIEHNHTSERTVAEIDKTRRDNTVRHWGHDMHARSGSIAVIGRWLDQHMILGPVEPFKDPLSYEENTSFGMF